MIGRCLVGCALAIAAGAGSAAAQNQVLPPPKPTVVNPAPPPATIVRPRTKPAVSAAPAARAPPQRALERGAPTAPRLADAEACLAALAAAGGTFEKAAPIVHGRCGAPDPIILRAVGGTALQPSATLRCSVALAFAQWVEASLRPAARRLFKSDVESVRVSASYHCRMRRGGNSRRLSEHGRANAIDVSALSFGGGRTIVVAERDRRTPEGQFQRTIREDACMYFTTVIGPGTNAAHADHFHFDLAERRGGYRVCE